MLSMLKRLLGQQSGNDLVEYALLLALITVAVIVSIYSFGRSNQHSVSRASQVVTAGGSGGADSGDQGGGGQGSAQAGGGDGGQGSAQSGGSGDQGGGQAGGSGDQGSGQSGSGGSGGSAGTLPRNGNGKLK